MEFSQGLTASVGFAPTHISNSDLQGAEPTHISATLIEQSSEVCLGLRLQGTRVKCSLF